MFTCSACSWIPWSRHSCISICFIIDESCWWFLHHEIVGVYADTAMMGITHQSLWLSSWSRPQWPTSRRTRRLGVCEDSHRLRWTQADGRGRSSSRRARRRCREPLPALAIRLHLPWDHRKSCQLRAKCDLYGRKLHKIEFLEENPSEITQFINLKGTKKTKNRGQ